jgi:hypothetical protein
MPASAPRHPACSAATSRPSRRASSTGTQSAVAIASSSPGRSVNMPSASPQSSFSRVTTAMRVPWRSCWTGRRGQ